MRGASLLVLSPLVVLLALEWLVRATGLLWQLDDGRFSPLRTERLLRQSEPGGTDIFVVGSSVARDVSARQLSRALQRRCVNLSTDGDTLASTAMLIPGVVARSPERVVLVLTNTALGPPELALRPFQFYDLDMAREIFTWTMLREDPRSHLEGAAGLASSLLRRRNDLRRALLAGTVLEVQAERGERGRRFREAREAGRRPVAIRRAVYKGELVVPGGVNERALAALWNALDTAGIDLVVALAPVRPGVVPGNYVPRVWERLVVLESELGFDLVDIRELGNYEPKLFRKRDFLHLDERGVALYTRAVAAHIGRRGRSN